VRPKPSSAVNRPMVTGTGVIVSLPKMSIDFTATVLRPGLA
jgi:hypothetical protein